MHAIMPKYRYNRYRDLEIDVSRLGPWSTLREFEDIVRDEFRSWSSRLDSSFEKHTAVMWLNVPVEMSDVLAVLLTMEPKFIVHHANRYRFMLVCANRPQTAQIPSYGTHYVKVECIVVERNTNRVLAVRERLDTASKSVKFVTGSAEAGEFIADAAMREVLEETRVKATFFCLAGCGNRLRTRFDRDEIIVGCLLFADEGQHPSPDGSEVREAQWMDVTEFSNTCTPMSREWLNAASRCREECMHRKHTSDLFRGHPYTMDFFVSRER